MPGIRPSAVMVVDVPLAAVPDMPPIPPMSELDVEPGSRLSDRIHAIGVAVDVGFRPHSSSHPLIRPIWPC